MMVQQRPGTRRPFWLSAFLIVAAIYIVASFIHGSLLFFWIRMISLLLLLGAAVVAAGFSARGSRANGAGKS